jgi:heat shock protein HtpX
MSDTKNCPRCGYENKVSAKMCALCGGVFPEVQAQIAQDIAREVAAVQLTEIPPVPSRRDFVIEMARNRRLSFLLLLGFPIIVILIGWAIGGYFGYSFYGIIIAALVALGYLTVVYYAGDQMILSFSAAHRADPEADQQLINVVDEMRIAAGLAMPEVYVIESDAANAFATGRDPAHGKVVVTRGLLKLLNRDELQGVVAHEMSHIRNYDIRYAMLVAALVGAIALLADGFRRSFWWSGGGYGRRRIGRGGVGQGQGGVLVMIALVLLALLAQLFAVLLQMAISRKREFLADASAVELTRNPLGLASALEKLDNHLDRELLASANRATQHLYIVNPFHQYGMNSVALFSTHPPIQARISLLRSMA